MPEITGFKSSIKVQSAAIAIAPVLISLTLAAQTLEASSLAFFTPSNSKLER